jgi:ATP-dependent Clp protease ATP-binding subunit ClpC
MLGRLTASARKVIHLANQEAERCNDELIGTGHFLLALLREPEGTASHVLVGLGLNLDDVREKVLNYHDNEHFLAHDRP